MTTMSGTMTSVMPADLVNDSALHGLDGNWRLIDAQHTAAFTRGRAHSASELREVVGLKKAVQCFLPSALVHQVIPFWYQIAKRTTCSSVPQQIEQSLHSSIARDVPVV